MPALAGGLTSRGYWAAFLRTRAKNQAGERVPEMPPTELVQLIHSRGIL